MSTTHKQAQAMLEADLRLTSMGVLCPMARSSRDDEWLAAWTKASQQATLQNCPVDLEFPLQQPREPAPS